MKIGRYLIGLASGLTFGVLFAPKKGKDLRGELTKGKGDMKALGKAFRSAGEEALDELKKLSQHEQVEAFLELSKEKMQAFLEGIDDGNGKTVEAAKAKLEEISAFALEKAEEFSKKAKKASRALVSKKKAVAKKAPKKKPAAKRGAKAKKPSSPKPSSPADSE